MSTRADLKSSALLWAVLLGVLADALVPTGGRPGLNIALWALEGVFVLYVLLQRRSAGASAEAKWLVAGALGFAGALMLRDADALAVFSLFAAVALLIMAAGRGASAWAVNAHVSDVLFAIARVAALCAAGPLGWGRAAPEPASHKSGWKAGVRTFARGTVMALPALVVLTALLMSADAVFARLIESAFRIDIGPIVEHVLFAGMIAWFTAGYLRAFLVRDDAIVSRLRVPQPSLSQAEVSVALWILNLLFIGFMIVQMRYLFGGAGLVEVTAGLTYAEYARRGFFELVATAVLVVPILLLADWAVAPDASRSRGMLRLSAVVLVVLLVGVIASAAYRMKLYQDAYGLTELRMYVNVFIVWLTCVLGLVMFTVLRGRRDRIAFGSIIAGFACIAGLYILNPHALIARVNLDRAAAGQEYDATYLRSLSADAVPVIVSRLARLPEAERCQAAGMLAKRWTGGRPGGWRSWNVSDWRARRMVARMDPSTSTAACT